MPKSNLTRNEDSTLDTIREIRERVEANREHAAAMKIGALTGDLEQLFMAVLDEHERCLQSWRNVARSRAAIIGELSRDLTGEQIDAAVARAKARGHAAEVEPEDPVR